MSYVSSNDVSAELVNPALADLADRIGSLAVSNALLVAENRLLLELLNCQAGGVPGGLTDPAGE